MPGLSQDPDAAARQLDGLERGRQTQARGLLEALGFTVARARSREPAVHAYPEPEPEPPNAGSEPTNEPEPGPGPEPERPPAGGFLARLRDGFAFGLED